MHRHALPQFIELTFMPFRELISTWSLTWRCDYFTGTRCFSSLNQLRVMRICVWPGWSGAFEIPIDNQKLFAVGSHVVGAHRIESRRDFVDRQLRRICKTEGRLRVDIDK